MHKKIFKNVEGCRDGSAKNLNIHVGQCASKTDQHK